MDEVLVELMAAAIAREGPPRGQEGAGAYHRRLARAALKVVIERHVLMAPLEGSE